MVLRGWGKLVARRRGSKITHGVIQGEPALHVRMVIPEGVIILPEGPQRKQ